MNVVFNLEDLWPEKIREIGNPGECIHWEPTSGPTSVCKSIKEKIVTRKKYVIQAMAKQDSSVSVHAINENLHNIERLRQNWENLHFNPPYKWAYLSWKERGVPVYYYELKQKYTHWTNSNYKLDSIEDFPPLPPVKSNEVEEEATSFSVASFDLAVKPEGTNSELYDNGIEEVKEKSKNEEDEKCILSLAQRKESALTYAEILSFSLNELKEREETCEILRLDNINETEEVCAKITLNDMKGPNEPCLNASQSDANDKKFPSFEAEKNILQRMLAEIFDGDDD